MAAHQAGLGVTIHKLWAWLGLDIKLMTNTLLLLTTYTARCPAGMSPIILILPFASLFVQNTNLCRFSVIENRIIDYKYQYMLTDEHYDVGYLCTYNCGTVD